MNPANRARSPVQEHLQRLHENVAGIGDGQIATYIPELAKADPNWFGISLATVGGCVYEVGDSRQPFTIQSISKPFVYGMALEDHGRADMLKKVGVEPSGDVFNAISLERDTGRPLNPMINAGAIACTGLIAGKSIKTRLNRLLETFTRFAGRDLEIDEAVYRSESETGHRNRAIGHMLRNFNVLTDDPLPVVDLYFKQCSISVDCRDLAIMAATLANHGVNPLTGKQALRGEYVESVLSVMGSCGMYDFAGEWIYKVGMPAKSGVSGGIIAVLPGQIGIGVYSPLLDVHGNSIRGIRACEDLSRFFDLHLFNAPQVAESVVRLRYTAREVNSNRVRTPAESEVLRRDGDRVSVYEIQGRVVFATMEVVAHEITQRFDEIDYLILGMKRVSSINESGCRLLYDLLVRLTDAGKSVFFTETVNLPLLRRYMRVKLGPLFAERFRVFDHNDFALEFCEDALLRREMPEICSSVMPLAECELFAGLSAEEIETIEPMIERRFYGKNKVVIETGGEALELFILLCGTVSARVTLPSGAHQRLATLCPGMTFGEMAVIDGAPRSATIVADSDIECAILSVEELNRLIETHPRIKIALLKNMNLALCRKLRKANREISVLSR